ncbi:hypothetical protein [Maritimibacter dapengensis]|uniref:Ferrochelatase n=1 Tax=Maritimibacter dapengensis TaxID=2836868 RepID=A0ABS6T5U5_9RHOB|nr:hypothetical protein [Maritimibacter dapengensis]MBV7379727.1 hypothetical protein [Maritimibacter dapengensis]
MKKLAIGLTLALVATAASAGALVEPIMEQEVIVQSTSSSVDHGIIPPIFFLLFVGIGFWLL